MGSPLLGPGSGGTLAPSAVSPKGGASASKPKRPKGAKINRGGWNVSAKGGRRLKRLNAGSNGGGGGNNNGGGGNGGGGNQPAPGDAYNLDLPTTPQDTKSYVDSLIRLTYGPQTSALKTQLAKTPSYFDAYRTQLGQLGTASDNRYQSALGQVGALGQQLGGYAGQVLGQVQGQGVTGQTATDIANAGVVQQGQLANWGGQLASHGQAMGNWYGQQQAISTPLQMEVTRGIKQALIDLKGDKGAARSKALGDLRDDRQQQKVDEAAAAALSGKTSAEIAQILAGIDDTTHDNAAQDNETNEYGYTTSEWAALPPKRRKRIIRSFEDDDKGNDVNEWGYTNDQWDGFSPERRRRIMRRTENWDGGDGSGSGGLSDDDETDIRKIKAQIRSLRRNSRDALGNPPTLQMIKDRLLDKYPYDPRLIRIAVDQMPDKYIKRLRGKPDVDSGDLPGGDGSKGTI